MAKRGRAVSIDKLVKQLNQLDNQRKALTSRIRQAVGSLLGAGSRGGESPFPVGVGGRFLLGPATLLRVGDRLAGRGEIARAPPPMTSAFAQRRPASR